MRIAWFSPMPPSRSGIAAYSSEILPLLRPRYEAIDIFVDRAPLPGEQNTFSAHDFVWKQRRHPYELIVYQMGNALCHGYMWAYLFRYPGLVVLHDAQLHQSRALWLMRRAYPRYDDYIAEFAATEPHASPDIAHVIVAGLGAPAFYQHWPMLRFVLARARLAVVHHDWLRSHLAAQYAATIDAIEMGVADPWLGQAEQSAARARIRERHGIPPAAVVVAGYGGVTPEKRIESLVGAVGDLRERLPAVHLLLVGEEAAHYDVRADAARWGVADRVHVTGYVADDELPAYLAAADICSCLRWPTNRETSASWLRCLAAGKPTLITALAQNVALPEIAVSIDVLEEARALPQAIASLAGDAAYRARLGEAARAYWRAHHQLEHMATDYARVMARAATLTSNRASLPAHISNDGSEVLRDIATGLGARESVAELLDQL